MTSGARELLKWIALILMTGDHIAKVLYDGQLPIVSALGRIAFPVFAVVLAYNLSVPGVHALKSFRRLLLWGILAEPLQRLALGYWLPFDVLLSFAVAAAAIWSIQQRQWVLFGMCALVAPMMVDYRWSGFALVLSAWWLFRLPVEQQGTTTPNTTSWRRARIMSLAFVAAAFGLLCWYNRNGWTLLAIPLLVLMAPRQFPIPRARWVFYCYYLAHLAVLAVIARVITR